jgi:opacity protein-like surface antigen
MKKLIHGTLAALLAIACVSSALAADVTPLVIDVGKFRQMKSGETVGLAHGGTGATDAAGARTALGWPSGPTSRPTTPT